MSRTPAPERLPCCWPQRCGPPDPPTQAATETLTQVMDGGTIDTAGCWADLPDADVDDQPLGLRPRLAGGGGEVVIDVDPGEDVAGHRTPQSGPCAVLRRHHVEVVAAGYCVT
jgi:hypothetical protein